MSTRFGRIQSMQRGKVSLLYTLHFYYIFYILCFRRFHDPQFRQMITDRYLEERAAFRRTGKSSSKRRLEEYREWKEANSNLSNAQNS